MRNARAVLFGIMSFLATHSQADGEIMSCAVDENRLPPVGKRITLVAKSLERSAVVQEPLFAPIGVPLPAVIMLHALGDSAENAAVRTNLARIASRKGFIIVFADGCRIGAAGAWNAGPCCAAPMHSRVDDVAFVGELIKELAESQHADPERIYLLGESNGGSMVYRALERHAKHIAAAGVLNGPRFAVMDSQGIGGVPILTYGPRIFGGMPYISGYRSISAEADGLYSISLAPHENFQLLATANGCGSVDSARREAHFAFKRRKIECAAGPVVQFINQSQRPSWGLAVEPGKSVAESFFEFFRKHKRGDKESDALRGVSPASEPAAKVDRVASDILPITLLKDLRDLGEETLMAFAPAGA